MVSTAQACYGVFMAMEGCGGGGGRCIGMVIRLRVFLLSIVAL